MTAKIRIRGLAKKNPSAQDAILSGGGILSYRKD